MDEKLTELKRLVSLLETNSLAPRSTPTKEDLLAVAELLGACGRIVTKEVNDSSDTGAALRPWKKIVGHILMAIALYLLED